MKWAYDLTGAEIIIKDVPVYDSATIAYGEMVQLGTTNFTAGGSGKMSYVTAGPATSGASTVADGLGVSVETKTTDSSPSIDVAMNTTADICTAKVIVNPFAVYRAQIEAGSTANTGALAIASCSAGTASATSALTITGGFTSTAAGNFQGQWVIFTATAGPNYGTIRRVLVSGTTAGDCDLDVALKTTATTDDKVVLLTQPGSMPNTLTVDGIKIGMNSAGSGEAMTAGCRVVDNIIDRGVGLERLTINAHLPGSTNSAMVNTMSASTPLKVYQDIVIRDHVFGVDL